MVNIDDDDDEEKKRKRVDEDDAEDEDREKENDFRTASSRVARVAVLIVGPSGVKIFLVEDPYQLRRETRVVAFIYRSRFRPKRYFSPGNGFGRPNRSPDKPVRGRRHVNSGDASQLLFRRRYGHRKLERTL